MDVILNTESLSPPLTGIGNYTLHLLNGLRAHSAIGTVCRFAGARDLSAIEEEAGDATARLLNQLKNRVRAWPGAYPLRSWLREQSFKHRFRHRQQAVYHEPNYILKRFGGPSVATIHDTSHLLYPEFHPRERVAYLERQLPATLSRADQLITLSEFMRGELMRRYAIAAERITAIHLGVDARYQPCSAAQTRKVLARLGLHHGGYLLSVATLEPRKNLIGLLRAHRQLAPALRARYPLVLVGAQGWHGHPLAEELRRAGDGVRLTGYLPARDLPQVYSGAAGFALVSHFEGFGLPALEAMASGVPLMASARSALPEVAADAALYVEPEDIDDMADKLSRLLEDQRLRETLIQRGVERAARFRWADCVEQTVAVYRCAAEKY